MTYLGAVHGTMAAQRCMRERNHGTIVQVGSALSYRAIPLQSAYCGVKFAIRDFTDALRRELIHECNHVRLTMVQLPAYNTAAAPLGAQQDRLAPSAGTAYSRFFKSPPEPSSAPRPMPRANSGSAAPPSRRSSAPCCFPTRSAE